MADDKLSDGELRQQLKAHGVVSVGPISDTTRGLWAKKLEKLKKEKGTGQSSKKTATKQSAAKSAKSAGNPRPKTSERSVQKGRVVVMKEEESDDDKGEETEEETNEEDDDEMPPPPRRSKVNKKSSTAAPANRIIPGLKLFKSVPNAAPRMQSGGSVSSNATITTTTSETTSTNNLISSTLDSFDSSRTDHLVSSSAGVGGGGGGRRTISDSISSRNNKTAADVNKSDDRRAINSSSNRNRKGNKESSLDYSDNEFDCSDDESDDDGPVMINRSANTSFVRPTSVTQQGGERDVNKDISAISISTKTSPTQSGGSFVSRVSFGLFGSNPLNGSSLSSPAERRPSPNPSTTHPGSGDNRDSNSFVVNRSSFGSGQGSRTGGGEYDFGSGVGTARTYGYGSGGSGAYGLSSIQPRRSLVGGDTGRNTFGGRSIKSGELDMDNLDEMNSFGNRRKRRSGSFGQRGQSSDRRSFSSSDRSPQADGLQSSDQNTVGGRRSPDSASPLERRIRKGQDSKYTAAGGKQQKQIQSEKSGGLVLYSLVSFLSVIALLYVTNTHHDKVGLITGIVRSAAMDTVVFVYANMILPVVFIAFCSAVLGSVWFLRKLNVDANEKERNQVFKLVEEILEVLEKQFADYESGHRKESSLPMPYVRDILIPPKDRASKSRLWDKAAEYINESESCVRSETSVVNGHECVIWEWLPEMAARLANHDGRKKRWQQDNDGNLNNNPLQAAGVLNVPPTIQPFSEMLKIRGMFDPELETDPDWSTRVQDSILERLTPKIKVFHLGVDRTSKEGVVYMLCASIAWAGEAFNVLHGFLFNGRLVTVKYLRPERYAERFPDAVHADVPLKVVKPRGGRSLWGK